jgi:hypothetical protein
MNMSGWPRGDAKERPFCLEAVQVPTTRFGNNHKLASGEVSVLLLFDLHMRSFVGY